MVSLAEAVLTDQDTSAILGALVGLLFLDIDLGFDLTLLGCTGRALSTSLVRNTLDQAVLDSGASSVDGADEDPIILGAGVPVAIRSVNVS